MTVSVLSGFTSAEASAIARAALSVYLDETPSFREELSDRLTLVVGAIDHLENITGTAAIRNAELLIDPLYNVIRLISREIKMINALVNAIQQQQREVQK